MSYDNEECAGCGITIEELMTQEELTYDDICEESVWLNSGAWYCHRDCFRDSN